MYLAEYTIGNNRLTQGVIAVTLPDPVRLMHEAARSWAQLLTFSLDHSCDIFVRLSSAQGTCSLIVGVTGYEDKRDTIPPTLAQLFPSSVDHTAPDSAITHDALLAIERGHKYIRKGHGYRVGSTAVAINICIAPHIGTLLKYAVDTQQEFHYQINATPLQHPREIERSARKHVLSLDDEPFVPHSLIRMQNDLAKLVGTSQFAIDEGYATDSDNDYLNTLIEDETVVDLHRLGFSELPYVQDEDADDWFATGLHLSRLQEQGPAFYMASAQSLSECHKLFSAPLHDRPDQPTEVQADIFISYSSSNTCQALDICGGIESAGIPCWIAPRNILPGESYPSAIMRGIHGCKILVLVFSDQANLSPHVLREVERALSLGKHIIPFRLDDCTLSNDMEYLISSCHWLDALKPPLSQHIKTLTTKLKHILSQPC